MNDRDSRSEPSREELIALVAAQAAEITALKTHIAELERRLGLNSSNSGKPPSSDGLKKPARVRSLREKSERKPGGQMGHEGETLRQTAKPDTIEDHFPVACAACGAATRADFPAGVNAPVQYGARITAFVVYLLHYQLLPEARLVALMAALFGVKLSAASLAAMSSACARRLKGLVETIRDHIAGAPVNTWTRPAVGSAARHSGCMSPARR